MELSEKRAKMRIAGWGWENKVAKMMEGISVCLKKVRVCKMECYLMWHFTLEIFPFWKSSIECPYCTDSSSTFVYTTFTKTQEEKNTWWSSRRCSFLSITWAVWKRLCWTSEHTWLSESLTLSARRRRYEWGQVWNLQINGGWKVQVSNEEGGEAWIMGDTCQRICNTCFFCRLYIKASE